MTTDPNDVDEIDRLLGLYYTEDEARTWLRSPQPLLDGQIAADLIANGQADKVLAVLKTLDSGTYL